ncbi:molecular chaperone DnaK [Paenibacillus swuensis]|uniref:Molecular chaperone DnaK n=1 Tax=Paenibacillus swuensis TaxID=1178515 RepID=A0A172TK31_9BACL|nr:TraR/DksA C4-type zinc finger protein [Paenibacillus swuensis]ANE47388.1 molecular chaperone DnaK [Paenibacillus swuensis]
MSSLNQEQQSQIKRALLEDKRDLERHFELNDAYGLSDSLGMQTGELSAYDNHPGDLATEVYERGKDIALNENAEHELEQVNQALEAMKKGNYGICAVCKADIPFDRLEAMPTTRYCKEHVPDPEISYRRPVEEELLSPPFGRTSLDEYDDADEQNQFDGEDAWQIVESWGTSNTPAMQEGDYISDYDSMYIEADENEGYVEPIESFLATDMYGGHVSVIRNKEYRKYLNNREGDPLLVPDEYTDA